MRSLHKLPINVIFFFSSALLSWPNAWEMAEALGGTGQQIWSKLSDLGVPILESSKGYLGHGLSRHEEHLPEEIRLYELIKKGYQFNAFYNYHGSWERFVIALTYPASVQLPPNDGAGISYLLDRGFKIKERTQSDNIIVADGPTMSAALAKLTSFFQVEPNDLSSFPIVDRLSPTKIGDIQIDNFHITKQFLYSGSYIEPNELAPYLFEPFLRNKKGVLISVGSLRTFMDASFGNFDLVVNFDIDRAVSLFNFYHQNLITWIDKLDYSTLEKRALYLLSLEYYWPENRSSLQKIIDIMDWRGDRQNRLNIRNKQFAQCKGLLKQGSPPAHVAKIVTYMNALRGASPKAYYWHALREGSITLNDILLENFYRVGHFGKTKRSPDVYYYWESDAAWEKLVSYFKAGKVKYITGNIANKKILANLARGLKNLGFKISILDISNILQDEEYLNKYEQRLFAESFLEMDLDSNAMILQTGSFPGSKLEIDRDDIWFYHRSPMKEFLKEFLDDLSKQ